MFAKSLKYILFSGGSFISNQLARGLRSPRTKINCNLWSLLVFPHYPLRSLKNRSPNRNRPFSTAGLGTADLTRKTGPMSPILFNRKSLWNVSLIYFRTVSLVFLFSLYMSEKKIPLPAYSKNKKCHILKYPVFKLLPVIVYVFYVLCVVLVLTMKNRTKNVNDNLQKCMNGREEGLKNIFMMS